jgi:hypothetical protein
MLIAAPHLTHDGAPLDTVAVRPKGFSIFSHYCTLVLLINSSLGYVSDVCQLWQEVIRGACGAGVFRLRQAGCGTVTASESAGGFTDCACGRPLLC